MSEKKPRSTSRPGPADGPTTTCSTMNRDWAALTQPETRARVKAVLEWYPQVFVDLHEMARTRVTTSPSGAAREPGAAQEPGRLAPGVWREQRGLV